MIRLFLGLSTLRRCGKRCIPRPEEGRLTFSWAAGDHGEHFGQLLDTRPLCGIGVAFVEV